MSIVHTFREFLISQSVGATSDAAAARLLLRLDAKTPDGYRALILNSADIVDKEHYSGMLERMVDLFTGKKLFVDTGAVQNDWISLPNGGHLRVNHTPGD